MTTPAPESFLPSPADTVIVEGPDAESFLQGQVSQDVASVGVGGWAWTFVLSPDGKVDALARLRRTAADRFELVLDAGFGEPLHTRLLRFKLRTDCEVGLEADPENAEGPDIAEFDRIDAGVLRMGTDVEPGDLAASTGFVAAAVDFEKGCYVGQELVARMDSRGGTAPTRLVRLRGGGAEPAPPAAVEVESEPVGQVTSSAAGDSSWVALARVSRKLTSGHAMVNGVSCTVEEL